MHSAFKLPLQLISTVSSVWKAIHLSLNLEHRTGFHCLSKRTCCYLRSSRMPKASAGRYDRTCSCNFPGDTGGSHGGD